MTPTRRYPLVGLTALLSLLPAALPSRVWGQAGPAPADLLTVRRGTIPIIVSAPHGGRKAIPGVPPRKGVGVHKFVTTRDSNTAELADQLAADLERRLGGKPFVVIARFDRKYLDVNRPAADAYESAKARPLYDAYHKALDDACRAVQKGWGRGLLLDLHGQAAKATAVFRGTNNGKTVTLLLQRFGPAALSGPKSLVGQLEKRGCEVVPAGGSRDREDRRFGGGYTVQTHGSHQGHGIDAIQLEWGANFRSKAALGRTARDLGESVRAFGVAYLPEALVPRAVTQALRARFAGAEVLEVQRRGEGDTATYAVTLRQQGRRLVVTFSPQGQILTPAKAGGDGSPSPSAVP